jgi:hypothetical protein
MAPAWIAERGVCAWLAVLQRLRFGGIRYGDSVIRVAANRPAGGYSSSIDKSRVLARRLRRRVRCGPSG